MGKLSEDPRLKNRTRVFFDRAHAGRLLAESAHPFHPKALRASGGTALEVVFREGPALAELPDDLPIQAGMVTRWQRAVQAVEAGATSPAEIRRVLGSEFPGSSIYFQPADIISQVLNFGLSAPVDVQVEGPDLRQSMELARTLRDRFRLIPGMEDVRIAQVLDYPALQVDVDRSRAAEVGLTERDVANNLLVALSGSAQTAPLCSSRPSMRAASSSSVPVRWKTSTSAVTRQSSASRLARNFLWATICAAGE